MMIARAGTEVSPAAARQPRGHGARAGIVVCVVVHIVTPSNCPFSERVPGPGGQARARGLSGTA